MAKDIKFNIKLLVDGKEQVVTASADIKDLATNIKNVRDRVIDADRKFSRLTQTAMALGSAVNAVQQISTALNEVTEDSRCFSAAMKSIGGNLTTLRKAMAKQRAYDRTTVNDIVRMARTIIDSGNYNSMTRGEVKRLVCFEGKYRIAG